MKNKAMIFLNGNQSDTSRAEAFIDEGTLLIGCDGGAEKIFGAGLKPHVIIGDYDSLDDELLKYPDIKYIKLPRDKDYTDSEAAIKYAVEKASGDIILTGLLGDRIDHILGNIYLLDKKEFGGAKIKIIEGKQEISIITGGTTIRGEKGDNISFLPLFGEVYAESSTGLKYDLAEYDLSTRGNMGLSNELIGDSAKILLSKGKLLAVHEKI